MNVFINDRSDLNVVSCIKVDGKRLTYLEMLEEGGCHRADVVLINGTRSGEQYCLYVSEVGFVGDMWILDVLTDEQHAKLEWIAFRMRLNATVHVAARKIVHGSLEYRGV